MAANDIRSRTSESTPPTDELFQLLKAHDGEWLSRTLQERWTHLSRKQPVQLDLRTVATDTPVWPFDITIPQLPSGMEVSDYIKFVRQYDWASTELGPMSSWSLDLRRVANMCLCDRRAAAVFVGANHIMFYNEAYSTITGDRHPQSLGRPFVEVWPEPQVTEYFNVLFERALHSGIASTGDDSSFIVECNGFKEELFVSWSVVPLPNTAGGVLGCYNTVFNFTKNYTSARRLTTLLTTGQNTALATSTEELWQQILLSCESNPNDIPFAVVYSLHAPNKAENDADLLHASRNDLSEAQNDAYDSRMWRLRGTTRIPDGYRGFKELLTSDDLTTLISRPCHAVLAARRPVLLSVEDSTFPEGLHGIAKLRDGDDCCSTALLLPLAPTTQDSILGFLIIGINPMNKYDSAHEQFASQLMRQCATAVASVVLMEEELQVSRLAAETAARDRTRLSAELAESQHQIVESEERFRSMADLAPVAMFHLDEEGRVLYANKTWYELTQHPDSNFAPKSWSNFVHPDDVDLTNEEFAKLTRGESVNFEMRWKRPFTTARDQYVNGERIEGHTWTLASAYPEKQADGRVKSIFGCLTDISKQKWMEEFQVRRVKDALELKRQQENFMDMISHETRNPLSAIMLSIESIAHSLTAFRDSMKDPVEIAQSVVQSFLDGADIIMTCAQHQKRIVDDVLTLSKLDSGLLTICPVEVRPIGTISQSIKMFHAEVLKHDITLDFVVDESYHKLQVEWVRLDPSRLLQVLINLLTNAIKFTLSEPVRNITVNLSAFRERPTTSLHGCTYVQNDYSSAAVLSEDQIVLSLEVIDTGRGITPEEMSRLFKKFQQANPRTHVEYGGSGLGLFISKQLSRMQGGAIGVTSEGSGATFAFYVVATRCSEPNVNLTSRGSVVMSSTVDQTSTQSAKDTSGSSHARGLDQAAAEVVRAHSQRQTTILLVEDNLINQKVMRTMLERANYIVHVANHGLEALDCVQQSHFSRADGMSLDVILMDVEMPVCNGLECTRRIRQLQRSGELNAHLPIVGVTANARTEQQIAAIQAGMDMVVTKPFRLQELSEALDKLMKRLSS